MHPDFEPIATLDDCRNGSCSTAWRNPKTGTLRFRGKDPADPTRELDIEWTADEVARLVPQLLAAVQG